MGLAHAIDRRDDQVTIVLAGEADATTADQLRDALFDEVTQHHVRITVDVRGLVFIDAGSIGTLAAARRAALQHHSTFQVTNAQGQVRRVLAAAGVLTTLSRTGVPGRARPAVRAPRDAGEARALEPKQFRM